MMSGTTMHFLNKVGDVWCEMTEETPQSEIVGVWTLVAIGWPSEVPELQEGQDCVKGLVHPISETRAEVQMVPLTHEFLEYPDPPDWKDKWVRTPSELEM